MYGTGYLLTINIPEVNDRLFWDDSYRYRVIG
jgi:hypothetical protein